MSVVSNGFQKFHMTVLASELDRLGKLTVLLTGGYPTSRAGAVLRGLEALGVSSGKWSRLLARGERMDESRVSSHWFGEAVYQLGARFSTQAIRSGLMAVGMGMYANSTARTLERMGSGRSRIFHYRSGFGGAAVRVAKRFGMIAVCDHSIVHPAFLSGLVRAGGKFDPQSKDDAYHPYWGRVVADCEAADAILVNSEFVRSTFLAKGFEPSRVHTIYLGVDDSFLEDVPEVVRQVTAGAPLRLMFGASLCDRRKGTHHLLEACRRLRGLPWELKIAGAIPDDMRREFRDVLESPAVRMLGLLSRKELAREMTDTDVFVCPSLAEGSARVIFEAMACGCHIITTPNSGSIVESDVHGQLIVPGDPESIVAAIRRALDSREWVGEVGARNSALVRGSYLQTHYGAAVLDLYEKLLRERMAGSR